MSEVESSLPAIGGAAAGGVVAARALALVAGRRARRPTEASAEAGSLLDQLADALELPSASAQPRRRRRLLVALAAIGAAVAFAAADSERRERLLDRAFGGDPD